MKKVNIILLSLAAVLSIGTATLVSSYKSTIETSAAYSGSSAPTTINLNDTTESNIRSYYGNLTNLSTSERQGTNLLKNLKPILKNNQKYYNYDSGVTVWQLYEIVDRDWDLSPASSISGYNAQTNTITGYVYGTSVNSDQGTNPYIHALYVDRSQTNQKRAWSNHKDYQADAINREHGWPKSLGMNANGAGARGDPMHLMPSDTSVNNNLHGNTFYGYVDKTKSYTVSDQSWQGNNLKGTSKTLGSGNVFEPQDSDKGDIARAVFYMVARYNYLSGSDPDGIGTHNPNLELVDEVLSEGSYVSTTTKTGKLGLIQDLLEWNRIDPPDAYEIHRNNLLYTNFTNNRNPFIDFPEWADYIWGSYTSDDYAKPATDTLNTWNDDGSPYLTVSPKSAELTVGSTTDLSVTLSESATVTWTTSNSSVATVSNLGKVTAVGEGTATITARATISGTLVSDTATITVVPSAVSVTGVSLNKSSTNVAVGETETLTATVSPSNATNKAVTWTSSNTGIATVNNGVVSGVAAGSATITVRTTDGNFTATCTVTVSSSTTYTWEETAIGDLSSSDVFVIVGNNGSNYALRNDNGTSGSPGASAVTVANGKITSAVANYIKWNISGNGTDGYTFYPDGSSTTWLYCTSSNTGVRVGTNTSKTFTIDSGYLKHVGTSRYIGVYNSTDWRCYTSINDNIKNQTFKFYKRVAETPTPVTTYSIIYNKNAGEDAVTNMPSNETGLLPGEHTLSTTEPIRDGYSFEGWSLTTDGDTTTSVTIVDEDVNVYAKWTEESSGGDIIVDGNTYTLVTSTSELQNNDHIVIVAKEYNYALSITQNTSNRGQQEITKTNNTIQAVTNVQVIRLLSNGNYFYLYMEDSSSYLYASSSSANQLKSEPSPDKNNNASFSISITNSVASIVSQGINSRNTIRYNNSSSIFSCYDPVNSQKDLAIYKLTTDCANKWATSFMSSITCDATGTNAPTVNWSSLSTSYSALDDSIKYVFRTATANENSTKKYEQAVARYDYIVSKYGTKTYANFMNRNIPSAGLNILVLTNNDTSSWLIIVISVISLSVISLYIFKRRKKYDN